MINNLLILLRDLLCNYINKYNIYKNNNFRKVREELVEHTKIENKNYFIYFLIELMIAFNRITEINVLCLISILSNAISSIFSKEVLNRESKIIQFKEKLLSNTLKEEEYLFYKEPNLVYLILNYLKNLDNLKKLILNKGIESNEDKHYILILNNKFELDLKNNYLRVNKEIDKCILKVIDSNTILDYIEKYEKCKNKNNIKCKIID